jgi:hypothetical protein
MCDALCIRTMCSSLAWCGGTHILVTSSSSTNLRGACITWTIAQELFTRWRCGYFKATTTGSPKHTISTHVVLGWKFLDMFKKIVIAIHPEYNTIFFTVTYYKSSCRMTWIIGKLVSTTSQFSHRCVEPQSISSICFLLEIHSFDKKYKFIRRMNGYSIH